MNEIIFCKEPMKTESVTKDLGINGTEIAGIACSNPTMLKPYTPYRVGLKSPHLGGCILTQLTPAPISRNLTDLSLSLGEDNVTTLADMFAILQQHGPGPIGAATSVYAHRIDGFINSVTKYQAALMEYRKIIKTNPVASALAKQKAHAAFQNMQVRFRHTLAKIASQSNARKGTPLTRLQRGLNIAKSGRSATKLNITSQVQANNLVMLSKNMKHLGNGLAIIDLGSRVGNIHNSYRTGESWERELFIESSSFAASAIAGASVVKAGSAALTLLVAATPATWVALIFCGVVVTGTVGVSMWTNNYLQNNSGALYDSIMNRIGSL
ncbi:MAG: hypothetical protein JEZ12_06555 [Desulfobacterium sp.]|nr:hypothetical protein [Desulfobacterium sp.]